MDNFNSRDWLFGTTAKPSNDSSTVGLSLGDVQRTIQAFRIQVGEVYRAIAGSDRSAVLCQRLLDQCQPRTDPLRWTCVIEEYVPDDMAVLTGGYSDPIYMYFDSNGKAEMWKITSPKSESVFTPDYNILKKEHFDSQLF